MSDPRIIFYCSGCGNQMVVASSLAGRRGKCTKCDRVVTIPGQAAMDEPLQQLTDAGRPQRQAADLQGSRSRPVPMAQRRSFLLAVAVIFSLAHIGLFLLFRNKLSGPTATQHVADTKTSGEVEAVHSKLNEAVRRQEEAVVALKAQSDTAADLKKQLDAAENEHRDLTKSLEQAHKRIEELETAVAAARAEAEVKLGEAAPARPAPEAGEATPADKSTKKEWVVEVVEVKAFDRLPLDSDIQSLQQAVDVEERALQEEKDRYEEMRRRNAESATRYRYYDYDAGVYRYKTDGKKPFSDRDLSECRLKIKQIESQQRTRQIKIKQMERQIEEGVGSQVVIAKDDQGQLVSLVANGNLAGVAKLMQSGQRYVVAGVRKNLRDGVQIVLQNVVESAGAK